MSTVETVAKAICCHSVPADERCTPDNSECPAVRDYSEARAAISALRVLSPKQERAVALANCAVAYASPDGRCDCIGKVAPNCLARARLAWAAGIDAMEDQ